MSRKTRYNIRLAGRKGLSIHSFDAKEAMEHLAPWYAIYCETAVRDGISIYPLSYYRRLFSLSLEREIPCRDVRVQNGFSCSRDQSLSRGQELSRELKVPKLCLYMASYDGTLLAGIIVAIWGKRATYLYGASSARHRELMPNHLLQWIAICDSRKAGAVEYDLFGLPGGADPGDSMHGLWRFKTGFGGILVHYFGAWDLPLRPVVYRFVRILEKGRRLIRKIF